MPKAAKKTVAKRPPAKNPARPKTALGALPEWNLGDLYSGLDDPAIKRDLDRAETIKAVTRPRPVNWSYPEKSVLPLSLTESFRATPNLLAERPRSRCAAIAASKPGWSMLRPRSRATSAVRSTGKP